MVSLLQSWNWLENRKSKDDKVSREMWKVVETKTRKAEITKRKKKREKRRREKSEIIKEA